MALLCNQSIGGGEVLDAWLGGMAEALLKGQWEALESSEMRRLDLLPTTPAHEWDELMLHPAYMHAMSLIP